MIMASNATPMSDDQVLPNGWLTTKGNKDRGLPANRLQIERLVLIGQYVLYMDQSPTSF